MLRLSFLKRAKCFLADLKHVVSERERPASLWMPFGSHDSERLHVSMETGLRFAPKPQPSGQSNANGWKEGRISLQRGFPPALLGYLVLSVPNLAPSSLGPPRATPWSRTSERSSSPYRRRVLVDVRAVGQVDEDGVHVLHVCDGDCQVGQSGQRLVFILVLEKTRVGEGGGGEEKEFLSEK